MAATLGCFNPHPSLLTGESLNAAERLPDFPGFNPHPSLLTGESISAMAAW